MEFLFNIVDAAVVLFSLLCAGFLVYGAWLCLQQATTGETTPDTWRRASSNTWRAIPPDAGTSERSQDLTDSIRTRYQQDRYQG